MVKLRGLEVFVNATKEGVNTLELIRSWYLRIGCNVRPLP